MPIAGAHDIECTYICKNNRRRSTATEVHYAVDLAGIAERFGRILHFENWIYVCAGCVGLSVDWDRRWDWKRVRYMRLINPATASDEDITAVEVVCHALASIGGSS